ncbi:MAG: HD domain-containing protein [Dehalococcoidales bacterium]|nr:HD domain-containing protein [Dehalococcoidales bacterium]
MVKYAQPGMVVELPVYDNYGNLLLAERNALTRENISSFQALGVMEIFIRDSRVMDVLVASLFSPQAEGALASRFRQIIRNQLKGMVLDDQSIEQVKNSVARMVDDMSNNYIGDVNVTFSIPTQDYVYLQPVKTAGLAMAVGRSFGLDRDALIALGMAAVFKDIGLDPRIIHRIDPIAENNSASMRTHPGASYNTLRRSRVIAKETAEIVYQHHERWDGSGYPRGLRGKDILLGAQIIGLADVFVDLLSVRPGRRRFMPHEAIEYVMAASGDQFDPAVVETFVRQVPCYPSGLLVQLSTGEVGITVSPKRGFIARPVVRICYTAEGAEVEDPYDIDLSVAEHQRKFITKVLEFE